MHLSFLSNSPTENGDLTGQSFAGPKAISITLRGLVVAVVFSASLAVAAGEGWNCERAHAQVPKHPVQSSGIGHLRVR